jgi:hypothetical protein
VTLLKRIGIALGVFVLVSALADLFGAANLGTALGFGQIAFAITAAYLIIRA